MFGIAARVLRALPAATAALFFRATALAQQAPAEASKPRQARNDTPSTADEPQQRRPSRFKWLPRGIERGPFFEAGLGVVPAVYSAVVSTLYASWYQRGVVVYGGKAAAGYGLGFGHLAVTATQHYFVVQDGMAAGKPEERRSAYGLGIRHYVAGWAAYLEASPAIAYERLSADRDVVDTRRPVGDRWTTVRECERATVRGAILATGLNLFDANLGRAGTLSGRIEIGAAFLPFPGGASRRSCGLPGAAPTAFQGADDPQLISASNATVAWRF